MTGVAGHHAKASTFGLLLATMVPQAVLSMLSLSPPVMMEEITRSFGLPPELTGLYTGLVYTFVLSGNLAAAPLIDRFGPLRLSFACVLCGGVGLALFGPGQLAALLIGVALIGLAYGPLTPANAQAISHVAGTSGFVFFISIRQTSVPLGGVMAGWLVPPLLLRLGWHETCIVLGAASAVGGLAYAVLSPIVRHEQPRGRDVKGRGVLQPVRLVLSNPALLRLALSSIVFGALQLVLGSFLVIYLVGVVGHDLVSAGFLLAVSQLAGIAGRPAWGIVADRMLSARTLLTILGVLMALSCLLTAGLAYLGPSIAALPVVILFGTTASGWNGVFLAELMRRVDPVNAGLATSGGLFFTYCGIVLGPPLFGCLSILVGLQAAFAATALAALAGAALAFWSGTPPRARPTAVAQAPSS